MISALTKHWKNIVLCYIILHGLYTGFIMKTFLLCKSTSLILFLLWQESGEGFSVSLTVSFGVCCFTFILMIPCHSNIKSFDFINAFEMFVVSVVDEIIELSSSHAHLVFYYNAFHAFLQFQWFLIFIYWSLMLLYFRTQWTSLNYFVISLFLLIKIHEFNIIMSVIIKFS